MPSLSLLLTRYEMRKLIAAANKQGVTGLGRSVPKSAQDIELRAVLTGLSLKQNAIVRRLAGDLFPTDMSPKARVTEFASH